MPKSKALIQLIFALVLSLAAGVLIFQWMRAKAVSGNVAGPKNVMVAVAAGNLSKGSGLGPESIKLVPYLPRSLPEGYFSDPEDLQGRMLAVDLVKNEPVTRSRLVSEDAAVSAVSAMITPGKRALAVKGNKVLGLAGFIRPGSRVDVLVTIDDESQNRAKSRTKIVLENIRVLASGTELSGSADSDPSPVDIYTLEVTPAQSEKLALAATRGTLHFALRNPADHEHVATVGASVPSTLAALRPVSEKPRVKAKLRTTVEVIRGLEKKRVRF